MVWSCDYTPFLQTGFMNNAQILVPFTSAIATINAYQKIIISIDIANKNIIYQRILNLTNRVEYIAQGLLTFLERYFYKYFLVWFVGKIVKILS
jgi:hypothetical protein